MPEYLYKCKIHGTVSVSKSSDIEVVRRPEYCGGCGQTMTRIFAMQPIIVRSPFWHLSPDDPKYSARTTFERERELGALKTITSASQDRTIMKEVAEETWAPIPDSVFDKIDQRGMQQISELCQATADDID
ncbi:MAG TPA: hypothetical protein VGA66_02845 [Mycobacterium sp.]